MTTDHTTGLFQDVVQPAAPLSIGSAAVDRLVRAIRVHMDLDVAFVAEFRRTDRIFRHVDTRDRFPLRRGDTVSLEEGYCLRIVDGRLPGLIPDAQQLAAARSLPATREIPIGTHLSVPIRLSDGRIFGTLCCFSFTPNESLGERDLKMMQVFAALLADQIDRDLEGQRTLENGRARIAAVLRAGQPSIAYQPIYDLATSRLVGLECLSRFNAKPERPPSEWFTEAAEVGMGVELEVAAIGAALEALPSVPAPLHLAVNCSPRTVLSRELQELLYAVELNRVVLELTEHDTIQDYPALLDALAPLRALGLRVAIDDAGAGYASLRHVLNIQPELIKLDISLTRGIDSDRARRALASALIAFARETDAAIVAEGVETAEELKTLKRLGARCAQGYFLARPMGLAKAMVHPFPSLSRPHRAQRSRRRKA